MSAVLLFASAWAFTALADKNDSGVYIGGNGGEVGSLAGTAALTAVDQTPAAILFFVFTVLAFFFAFGISPKVLGKVTDLFKRKSTDENEDLAALKATLCLYLSAHKVPEVAEELAPFYGADCPAAIVEKASWPGQQRILRGTLADIGQQASDAGIRATALIIVGEALARGHAASRLYASDFTHGFRVAKES